MGVVQTKAEEDGPEGVAGILVAEEASSAEEDVEGVEQLNIQIPNHHRQLEARVAAGADSIPRHRLVR